MSCIFLNSEQSVRQLTLALHERTTRSANAVSSLMYLAQVKLAASSQKTASSLSRFRWKTKGNINMANLGIFKGSTLGSCHIVEEILGEGNFGVVAKCRNTLTNKTAAVKVHKKKLKNAIEEIFILKWLHRHGSDACNIVRWDGYFFDKEKLCISFEHLDQSLHHYQMAQNAKRLSMVELKSVLHQLATALSHLHSIDIIHADLKPVNIMVVDRHQHPIKVKIIDFGLACFASQVQQGECRGTMSYNAPEMSLGVPFNEAIDMWALGVTMAELAMGCALYPGMTEYDVLRAIIETQGQPPDDMLDCGMYTEDFFYIDDYGRSCWRFMTPHDVYQEYGLRATDARTIFAGISISPFPSSPPPSPACQPL
uniref:Protein kinase domain-containing protein n=1 Tax=Amphiprion percula TaxID=161767 RepID=A0A3P8TXG5_AMPPE